MKLSEIGNSGKTGKPVPPKPNMPVTSVIEFVEDHLIEFSDRYSKSSIKNEKGLTQKLCRLLNDCAENHPFWFDKEALEDESTGNSPQVDIDVITRVTLLITPKVFDKRERFFAFEAKILGVKEKYRQKEYLIGYDAKGNRKSCGGVERFKKNIHGQGLNYAGLIGYILKENEKYWYSNINSWIKDLIWNNDEADIIWTKEDLLVPQNKKRKTTQFVSLNKRIKNRIEIEPIELVHLWVNLN